MSGLGSLPPSSAISWVPVFSANEGLSIPTMSTTSAAISVVPSITTLTSAVGVSAGSYLGEGLMPVPEKLANKIIKLEFVEMQDLMPETWLLEEEESNRAVLSLPRRRSAPVTDI